MITESIGFVGDKTLPVVNPNFANRVKPYHEDIFKLNEKQKSLINFTENFVDLKVFSKSTFPNLSSENISFKSSVPDWVSVSNQPRFDTRLENSNNPGSLLLDESWPWGVVGSVTSNGRPSGTGTLIGDRIVLTASHLVPWELKNGECWMRFKPAYYGKNPKEEKFPYSFVDAACGYSRSPTLSKLISKKLGFGNDWAILRLKEPLGKYLGYMGFQSFDPDFVKSEPKIWNCIGYPNDVASGMMRVLYQKFSVKDLDESDPLTYKLESVDFYHMPGNSGGPLFGWWGDDPRVVGVCSGGQKEKVKNGYEQNEIFASGEGMVRLCAWARQNWI